MHAQFRRLGQLLSMGVARPDLPPGLRLSPTGAYPILYRETPSGADIIRILHSARQWQGQPALNPVSIGIEIVNAGKLSKNGNGDWITWSGQKISPDQVMIARHKNETSDAGWHIYTTEQINVVVEIGTTLNEQYKFLDFLGHDDVSPDRKVDPGPAFPMNSVQSRIIGRS